MKKKLQILHTLFFGSVGALTMLVVFFIVVSRAFGQGKKTDQLPKSEGVDVSKDVQVSAYVAPVKEYHYLSLSKPSPFIPPMLSTLMASEEIPIESSLQKSPSEELKLVGVWTLKNGERKALVMTPSNEGVVVTKGTLIGIRGGDVESIDEDHLTVREYSLASDGSHQSEASEIWLEGSEAPAPENNVLQSEKVGVPNAFGYGKKNYTKSPTYDTKHADILKRLDEQKNEAPIDDDQPSFLELQGAGKSPESKETSKNVRKLDAKAGKKQANQDDDSSSDSNDEE